MQKPTSVLLYLRPTRLIYVRETGPYERTIPASLGTAYHVVGRQRALCTDRARLWAGARQSRGRWRPSIAATTPASKISPEFEDRAIRDLGITTLPGGAYACRRLSGSYDRMHSVVANVYSEFQALPGLGFDGNRPVVSIYVDNPNRYAENELRADICVPVMVVGDIGTSNGSGCRLMRTTRPAKKFRAGRLSRQGQSQHVDYPPREGSMAGIDTERTFIPVRIAILTMSDTRTAAEDKSGDLLERS